MTTETDTPLLVDPGGRDVGLILKTRRQEHQISILDMQAPYVTRPSIEIMAAESYQSPPVEAVRVWYSALILQAGRKASWQKLPYAARNQWYTTVADRTLWHTAMEAERRVIWWWGTQKLTAPRGAWCYVCSTMIHTFDVSAQMSHAARVAVTAHRAEHITALGQQARIDSQEERA